MVVDWTHAAQAYTNIEEMPSFLSQQRESVVQRAFTTSVDPRQIQGKQLQIYTIVQQHMEAETPLPVQVQYLAGVQHYIDTPASIPQQLW